MEKSREALDELLARIEGIELVRLLYASSEIAAFRRSEDNSVAQDATAIAKAWDFATADDPSDAYYFRPCYGFGGGGYPVLESVTDDEWQVIEAAADSTQNPVLKARYCDLLWVHGKDHKRARQAVVAYLEAARLAVDHLINAAPDDSGKETDEAAPLREGVPRALSVASALNDTDLVRRVAGTSLELCDRLRPDHLRARIDLLRAILESRMARRTVDSERLLEAVTHTTNDAHQHATTHPLDGELLRDALAVELRHAQVTQDGEHERDVRRRIAESHRQEAEFHAERGGNLAALTLMGKAASSLKQAGDCAGELASCQQRMEELADLAQGDMVQYGVEVEVPREEWDAAASFVRNGAKRFGIACLLHPLFLPDVAGIRTAITEHMEGSPLFALMPRSGIQDQRVVESATDPDEVLASEVRMEMVRHMQFGALLAREAVDQLRSNKALTADAILEAFSGQGIVQEWRRELIRYAARRITDGDYVGFMHVAVPQIEGILRDFLRSMGMPVTKLVGSTTQYVPLGEMLRVERLRKVLGEDLVLTLDALLADPAGPKLRQDLAHGEMQPDSMSEHWATIVLLLLVRLGSYQLAVDSLPPEEPTQDEPTDEQEE